MNSPLTVKVCVRLPSSISTLDNEPVFLEAYKGLNGLSYRKFDLGSVL